VQKYFISFKAPNFGLEKEKNDDPPCHANDAESDNKTHFEKN